MMKKILESTEEVPMKDYLKNPCPCGRLHTVAVDEVVKVMNIAKDNGYRLILATQAK